MSELYNLPDEWEWKKLGDLTTTTSGGTPKRNEKLYWGGNIGWLKSGELNDGYITNVEEYITDEGLTKSSAKLFPKGTLLIAMYGATAGKVSFLAFESSTNQAICAVTLDDNRLKYYFKFFIEDLYSHLVTLSSGSARDNLSQDMIKNKIFLYLNHLENERDCETMLLFPFLRIIVVNCGSVMIMVYHVTTLSLIV